MAAYVKYQEFVEDLAKGVHDFSTHTFKFALTNTAPTVATDVGLADITEIASGNGYTAGGSAVAITSAVQATGTLSVVPTADVVITASGGSIGPFRYVVLYNDTSTGDRLISYYDAGSNITLADGETLTIDVGATLLTIA